MLGSWSLGDYDGPQSLRWGYELLVDGFGIDPKWLHVTVYGGDGTVPPDTSSRRVWSELGVPVEVTVEDNWWDNGPVGPCGPDSEIFFWTGDGYADRHADHRRPLGGDLEPRDDALRAPATGRHSGAAARSRTSTPAWVWSGSLTVLQDKPSVFDCDVFEPWVRSVSSLWSRERQ